MMHHRTATTVTTLILCVCLLLSGCSARARQRDLIRNDPMASVTWDSIEFLGSKESEDDGPKPPPTSMTRCFATDLPLEEAFERILTTAKQNGWRRGHANGPKVRITSKDTSEGGMKIILSTALARCEQYPTANFTLTLTFG